MEGKQSPMETALHTILKNCHTFSSKLALHWLDSDCKVTEQYTYEQVEHRTRELANGLLGFIQRKDNFLGKTDVMVKERAVLCYPPGLEFILTFLACLRAGIIAVPVSPPNPHQPDYSAEMLVRIIHDCGAGFVLTSKEFANHKSIVELIKSSPVPWHCEVATELLPEESSDHEISDLLLDQAKLEDIPFLQYTSGSTGTPKGVMPTHNTLLNNFKLMQEIMKTDASMVEISFLPHFHAMGLICSYLQVLYHGGTGYFMSPVTFVENPGIWLKAFSLFHGTHTKAPNFAFELVLKKGFPKNADLSTARYIVTGSEPVSLGTIEQFESTLAPHGLKKNTVRVGYGLAEHSVYLCGVRNHNDPTVIDGRISCGVPLPGVIVKIVDPETHSVLPEGEEGEIWVDSPCKALGYWEKEEKSVKVFEAELDVKSDRTYLRTGDLGFMKNGELFVSGRVKNIIIVHGRKIHPSDIEMRIESSFAELQPGRSVACEYPEERSQDLTHSKGIVYVAELRSPKSHSRLKLDVLSKQISTMIGLNFQIECHQVVLIHPRTMPCTTSGKRQRSLCKKKLANNMLEEVFRWSRGSKTDGHTHQLLPQAITMRTGLGAEVMDSSLESEPEITMASLLEPHIDINILEPSDSESTLDAHSEHDSIKNAMSILEPMGGDAQMASLQVDYPNMVRTERRRSAPPLPVDRESKFKTSQSHGQRRKSAMDKSASMSRLYKRRNSLQTLTDTVSGVLGTPIQPDSNIWIHGCNSIKAIQLSQQLQSEFGFAVEPHHFFIHQTPKALLGKLQRSLLSMSSPPSAGSDQSDEPMDGTGVEESSSMTVLDTLHEVADEREERGSDTNSTTVTQGHDVAIVGMACSFAGCNDTEELWQMLINQKVATTSLSPPSSKDTISGGFTQSTGVFDYKWFGVSEWEASTTDPQQSMLLHTAWDCLQNAGSLDGLTSSRERTLEDSDCGVFVGISMDNDAHYLSNEQGDTPLPTSITSSVAANRIARTFNMKGPVMSIDTACASSLSALDVACKSLRDEDCSAALVCGVNAILDPYRYALLNKMGMLSPDELCKVFDASADGYVRGEGCGAIMLMPLALAEREGRRILAVVKSTALNNNGASSATLTSPSGKDQEALLGRALRKARLSAKDIAYIEAHGTGTKLGDPIEVDAIQAVFGHGESTQSVHNSDNRQKRMEGKIDGTVAVGSVKANVGHLETGAGIAGLVKSVMVLEHSIAPGNACLQQLNPCFHLSDNIRITSENLVLQPTTSAQPPSLLAAMVNSFGFGGTNATTVLQQYIPLPHMAKSECALLISTSTNSHVDLRLDTSMVEAAIGYLSSRFPAFQKAASACDDVVQKVSATLGKASLDLEMVAIMKMYYSLTSLMQSLGMKFVAVRGMDVVGEVLSLVIANSLDLDHAMFLVLTSWSSTCSCLQDLQKIIRPPSIPVLSCVMGKALCSSSASPTEIGSSEYCTQLIAKLKAKMNQSTSFTPPMDNSSNTEERLLEDMDEQMSHPLLSLVVDSSAKQQVFSKKAGTVIDISELHCEEEDNGGEVEQYIRKKLIEIRNESDRARMTKNPSRPMKDVEKNLMPDFHKRYPLRVQVDSKLQQQSQVSMLSPEGARMGESDKTTPNNFVRTPQTPRTPQSPHTPSPSAGKSADGGRRNGQMNQRKLSTLSTSSSVESGYLTQENSRESLPTSVPPNTPISVPPNNQENRRENLEYKLDRERLVLALKEKQPSTIEEQQKWEVVSKIVQELEEDLDSPDMSLEEVAESGMYDLGLDSLNVMQTAEYLNKTYKVKMTFTEVLDHETIGRLAEFIVKESPMFKRNEATGREEVSSSPSVRAPLQSLRDGLPTIEHTLVKSS